MRPARILEEASQEAAEAATWYESEQPGLGAEFFAAVDAAIDAIEENSIPYYLSRQKLVIMAQND